MRALFGPLLVAVWLTSSCGTTAPPAPSPEPLAASPPAPAPPVHPEFVWIDDELTWDAEHSFDSTPRPGPASWVSPVDYFRGQVHFRLEVQAKADDTPVWLELCQWQEGPGRPHLCMNCFQPPFRTTGQYTCQMSPAVRNKGKLDFSRPFVKAQIRIKDGSQGRGTDLVKGGKGLPIRARYSVVLVPAGQTFSGWSPAEGGASVNPLAGFGTPRRIVSKMGFTEGPLWLEKERSLLFTDVRQDTIWRLDESLRLLPFLRHAGGTGALALDANDGSLVFSEGGAKRISRRTRSGQLVKVLAQGPPKGFGPNDIIVHGSGNVFFTDPNGGHIVYRVPPEGEAMIPVARTTKPNGVAFSPDHSLLYFADTTEHVVYRMPVGPDGTPGRPEPFAHIAGEKLILDGICIDDFGNVYVTSVPGIHVFAADGRSWGMLRIPGAAKTSNCSFGGPDRRTLYVTAVTDVFAVPMKVPGLP